MKEINKAGLPGWLRDKKIIKVLSTDNLTKTDEKELSKFADTGRKKGNSVAVLVIEVR
jgi:hypothetical protein